MQITDSQKWLMLAVLIGTGALIYLLGPILTPFLLGSIFAYLGDPLADQLEEKGLSRTLAVVIVFSVMSIFIGILLFVLVPIISRQIAGVINDIPEYIDYISNTAVPWVSTKFPWISSALNIDFSNLAASNLPELVDMNQAGGVVKNILGYVGKSSGVVFALLANLLLIPVVTFYMLRDWDKFVAGIHHLLPRQIEPDVSRLASESDVMLSAFLRGQVLVMFALATIYSLGLWLVGVKFALLIGVIAGLVSFIPYMGLIVGIAIAGVAVLLQTQDPMALVWVIAVFGVGQVLEGALLTPMLVGDRIGMHPVAVIFSVLAGGQLFGFFGILVALPVAAVIAVIIRDLHRRYMTSHLYDVDGTTRMLADGPDNEQPKHAKRGDDNLDNEERGDEKLEQSASVKDPKVATKSKSPDHEDAADADNDASA